MVAKPESVVPPDISILLVTSPHWMDLSYVFPAALTPSCFPPGPLSVYSCSPPLRVNRSRVSSSVSPPSSRCPSPHPFDCCRCFFPQFYIRSLLLACRLSVPAFLPPGHPPPTSPPAIAHRLWFLLLPSQVFSLKVRPGNRTSFSFLRYSFCFQARVFAFPVPPLGEWSYFRSNPIGGQLFPCPTRWLLPSILPSFKETPLIGLSLFFTASLYSPGRPCLFLDLQIFFFHYQPCFLQKVDPNHCRDQSFFPLVEETSQLFLSLKNLFFLTCFSSSLRTVVFNTEALQTFSSRFAFLPLMGTVCPRMTHSSPLHCFWFFETNFFLSSFVSFSLFHVLVFFALDAHFGWQDIPWPFFPILLIVIRSSLISSLLLIRRPFPPFRGLICWDFFSTLFFPCFFFLLVSKAL